MISCFKRSATDDFKTDFENTHAISYTSTTDLSEGGPKISKIVESFRQYNVFKYAAYRTAFKLRTIQKASKLHLVNLAVINGALKSFNCPESLTDTVTCDRAAEILCALYNEASKTVGFAADSDVMSQVFCAFLQNAFVQNESPMLLVQLKITLTLFSSAKLSEKHKYFFYHCSSGGIMCKNGLQLLLKTLSKIAEIAGEQVTFGSHLVPAAIHNCLKYCKGKITEKRFKKWMSLDPETIVWLSTLHRIAISETTEHFISCDYCQGSPTFGLRYKCLQCINYDLCQNCFLRGFYNKGHKEGHSVQEFCLPASVWQETKATFNAVKNKLPFSKCPTKPYLSFDEESVCDSDSSGVISNPSIEDSIARKCSLKKSTSAYLIKELSSIISKLDEERKQITAIENLKNEKTDQQSCTLKSFPDHVFRSNSLQDFDSNVAVQLDRLRDVLKALKAPDTVKKETGIVSPVPHVPFHRKDPFFESTPMNSAAVPLQSKENIQVFSPQSMNTTRVLSKKTIDQSSDYSSGSFSSSEKENFAFSDSYSFSRGQTDSISLELTTLLNNSSPKGVSTKLSELNGDLSKLSPLYVCSSIDLEETTSRKLKQLNPTVLPEESLGLSSAKRAQSTFSLDKDGKLEIMEQELQAMLQQLEELLPQVSFLANDSRVEKAKVMSALSEMEEAVQKLSHLSIEISTGSTDL